MDEPRALMEASEACDSPTLVVNYEAESAYWEPEPEKVS